MWTCFVFTFCARVHVLICLAWTVWPKGVWMIWCFINCSARCFAIVCVYTFSHFFFLSSSICSYMFPFFHFIWTMKLKSVDWKDEKSWDWNKKNGWHRAEFSNRFLDIRSCSVLFRASHLRLHYIVGFQIETRKKTRIGGYLVFWRWTKVALKRY